MNKIKFIQNAVISSLLISNMLSANCLALSTAVIKQKLSNILSKQQLEQVTIQPKSVAGFYQVNFGLNILYVSQDGKYLFYGDIITLDKNQQNLTENFKKTLRKKLVYQYVTAKDMLVFAPAKKAKYTITVFTDVDCPYCRMLHKKLDDYLKQGIEVRYIAFPRAGINSDSYYKAETIWCAKDRQKAFNQATTTDDMVVSQAGCKASPLPNFMKLVSQLRITGTPSILLEDGTLVPGYLPADKLVKLLDAARQHNNTGSSNK